MNNPLKSILALPKGMLLFIVIYAVSFPVLLVENNVFKTMAIEQWFGLSPVLVWKGQVWRLVTYEFLGGGIIAWAVNLFWLTTLISILSRNWSALNFWIFSLVVAVAGAIPLVLILHGVGAAISGAGVIVYGLLAAWAKLYGRERIVMLGLGEMSVKQAAILVAVINAVIIFFSCRGPLFTLALVCGGLAGWGYVTLGQRWIMRQTGKPIESQRMARLEL